MLSESAPAATHIENAIARLYATGVNGKIQLAALSRLQGFIIALEHRLRIATRFALTQRFKARDNVEQFLVNIALTQARMLARVCRHVSSSGSNC